MSRPMNFKEFAEMVNFIQNHNSPFSGGHRWDGERAIRLPVVKYFDPVFDMRSNTVLSVTFRGFGSERLFHCQNECRELPESLFERVMKYLKGEDETTSLPTA